MSISRVAKYSDENEEMVAIMASGSRGQRPFGGPRLRPAVKR